jgi:3-isopropylmalate/(R)-2-methylmalate dehydratase large subunit
MRGMTLVEKIIARAAGKEKVAPGEVVFPAPDLVVLYDWFGLSDWFMDTIEKEFHPVRPRFPERILFFLDHLLPVQHETHAALHARTRAWCERHAVRYIEGEGIGHSVVVENGEVTPGMLVAHFDTHVSTVGAAGALGFGIMKELLMPLVAGKMWIQVPETYQVSVEGSFQKGVMGRDLLHRLVRDLGPDGCINRVMEFSGPGARNIGMESRMTICNLANFIGAATALFAPDEATLQYLRANAGLEAAVVRGDPDAEYDSTRHYHLEDIEPMLICPPTTSNALPLRERIGTPVNVGIIGTCASGRMEDLEIAARILKKNKVKKGVKLYVIPSSKRVFLEANKKGYVNTLIEAGAFVTSPTCDFCFGKAASLVPGDRAISTQTLNVPGRLGSMDAEIYLASSAAVAAAAVEGAIADPTRYL